MAEDRVASSHWWSMGLPVLGSPVLPSAADVRCLLIFYHVLTLVGFSYLCLFISASMGEFRMKVTSLLLGKFFSMSLASLSIILIVFEVLVFFGRCDR